MPIKTTIPIKLPMDVPDRCMECPLLGSLPQHQRQHKSQKTFVCIPTLKALSYRFISSRRSEHDAKHPMHKPCENVFNLWALSGRGHYAMAKTDYMVYRLPFEQKGQRVIDFNWNKRNRYGD